MTILPKKKTVGGKNEGENETHLGGGGYLASNQVITFKLKFQYFTNFTSSIGRKSFRVRPIERFLDPSAPLYQFCTHDNFHNFSTKLVYI